MSATPNERIKWLYAQSKRCLARSHRAKAAGELHLAEMYRLLGEVTWADHSAREADKFIKYAALADEAAERPTP